MPKKRREFDINAYRELDLYTDNTYPIYQRKSALIDNYKKKLAKGKFNMAKAEKGVLNLVVTPSARSYTKEFGGNSRTMFGSDVRKAVAKRHTRDIFRGINSGEY